MLPLKVLAKDLPKPLLQLLVVPWLVAAQLQSSHGILSGCVCIQITLFL